VGGSVLFNCFPTNYKPKKTNKKQITKSKWQLDGQTYVQEKPSQAKPIQAKPSQCKEKRTEMCVFFFWTGL